MLQEWCKSKLLLRLTINSLRPPAYVLMAKLIPYTATAADWYSSYVPLKSVIL
jgi:hypothetical protein